jgi:hypothetical protein
MDVCSLFRQGPAIGGFEYEEFVHIIQTAYAIRQGFLQKPPSVDQKVATYLVKRTVDQT